MRRIRLCATKHDILGSRTRRFADVALHQNRERDDVLHNVHSTSLHLQFHGGAILVYVTI